MTSLIQTRTAGLLYGSELHHLDHVAPLCSLMQIPLIAVDLEVASFAKKYYPDLLVLIYDYLEAPSQILENFDILFCSIPRVLFDEIFFFVQKLHRKKLYTIWCPHGNSDKGHMAPLMEGLQEETVALVYGQKMINFMKQKEIFHKLKRHVVVGNFRYFYYKKYKDFYDSFVAQEIEKKLRKGKKNILFCPTWQDAENSCSFFDALPILADTLPDEYNLIVKLHPNLLLQQRTKVDMLLWKYEERESILFVTDFPPIYPLLNAVDVYLGDMSSIGYDFLTFDKPLFFLNQNNRNPATDPGLYLCRSGKVISREEYQNIFPFIQATLASEKKLHSDIRKEIYTYTFGKERKWEDIQEEIYSTYKVFEEEKGFNVFEL